MAKSVSARSAGKAKAKARPKAKAKAKPKAKAKVKAKPTKVVTKSAAKPANKQSTASGPPMRMPPVDPAATAALEEVLGGRAELRAGKMFGCPGFFLGAKAVACVFGADVCLTLPPAEIDRLVSNPAFRRFQPRGRTMSGWVLVEPEEAMADSSRPLFEQAIAYARAKAIAQARS